MHQESTDIRRVQLDEFSYMELKHLTRTQIQIQKSYQHLRGLLISLPDPFHPRQKRTIILTSNNIRLVLSISQNVSKSHNVKTC